MPITEHFRHSLPLPVDAEHLDGHYRDRCVFSPDIDIYDTMSVKGAISRERSSRTR